MIILTKVLLTCVGVAVQTILALLAAGAKVIDASQFPVLHLIILIQLPLLTAIWTRHAKNIWRLAAYITGAAISVAALYFVSPHLQGFALSSFSSSVRLDSYGFFGTGLLGFFLSLGCMLVGGIIVPRAILSLGRDQ